MPADPFTNLIRQRICDTLEGSGPLSQAAPRNSSTSPTTFA